MIDRKWLYGGGIATVIGGAFLGIRSIAPTLSSELEQDNFGAETQINTAGYKKYTLIPGKTVLYESVPDPKGDGRDCVKVGSYSTGNTLFGATVVVGPDSSSYIDVPSGTIHTSDGTLIGYFERSKIVEWEDAPGADPDSIVCANN